ncbi:MAG TPA: STAS domain-containing protein [Candidatus Krumholzibacteria bacterium]|nr:STAS domain-containing protein [Candidatus Krumholzibacteria bacterium]
MSIEVTAVERGGVEIVAISGKIVGSEQSSKEFQELFQNLVAEGKRRYVIDLTETPWTNSLGVGMLMSAYTTVKKHGGDVVLANATTRIRDMLRVTRLDAVFLVHDSLDSALEHLRAADTSSH